MTNKEKLKKIVSLADKMYDAAFKLTTDASLLRKAMDDYHQFIIHEYHKEEPVSEELDEAADNCYFHNHAYARESFIEGANWQKEQIIANTTDAMIGLPYENKDGGYTHLIDVSRPLPVGNNKIAIIFKED